MALYKFFYYYYYYYYYYYDFISIIVNYIFCLKLYCMYVYNVCMYVCMYVRVLGDDGPLKIMTYHVTWLPSGNKAFTYLLMKVIYS